MKNCTTCLLEKSLSSFYKGKRYKDGYRSECKACANRRTVHLLRKHSLKRKPICSRQGCQNKIGLYSKKICSDECRRLLMNERQRDIYKTEEYKVKHREYMREKLNINPRDYRVNIERG